MTKQEYLSQLNSVAVNDDKVSEIEKVYGVLKNEVVKEILSNAEETIFLDDDIRSLEFSEIKDADKELHVGFSQKHFLPLFDCCENNFIIYNIPNNSWAMFNINDEVLFSEKSSLHDLLN